MKAASPSLVTYLSTHNTAYVAELISITRQDGYMYAWTTWDSDLLGHSKGPVISYQGGVLRQVTGDEVATLELEFTVGDDYILPSGPSGKPFPLAATDGEFDGASVQIRRLYMATPGDTSLGSFVWFEGVVGTLTPSSTGVKITVESILSKLNKKLPRRLFQPACPYSMYDAGCMLVRAWHNLSVASVTSAKQLTVSYQAGDPSWRQGTIEFMSGPCTGQHRIIASSTNGSLTLGMPLPVLPVVGNAVRLLEGCDKSLTRCTELGNQSRFGGFPWVPRPESVR